MSPTATAAYLLNTLRDSDLTTPSVKKILPDIQHEPHLVLLEAISSCPIVGCLGEDNNLHLGTASFLAVVESSNISPEPPG